VLYLKLKWQKEQTESMERY